MDKRIFSSAIAVSIVLPVLLTVCCTSNVRTKLPCDIYRDGGTPCVAAHSTTRQLDSRYNGPLYQIVRDSDGKTMDIKAVGGYADAAAQDEFLKGTMGRISIIYDQSGMGNDLTPASPGTFKGPDKGEFNTMSIADMAPVLINGRKAYGVYVIPGMGYRCNNAKGLAINDEPEGMYYVIDGRHYDSGCCFDYGNSSTNGRAVGTGTMETTYFGISTAWGSGNGEGPWIMSDMEAGLFSGYNAKKNDVPSITDWDYVSVFMNGGGGNHWDLRGADASADSLITFYSGVRPGTPEKDAYYPMHKKGGMLMGNGGDNGNGSSGTFFEGVMTFGYPTDEAIAEVQKSIAAQKYTTYPIRASRIADFVPGGKGGVNVAFINPGTEPVKGLSFSAEAPQGWTVTPAGEGNSFVITAPMETSSGYITFTAKWKGGSASVTERVRASEPVRINEVLLGSADRNDTQYIELYNAADHDVDLSGVQLVTRRSGWDDVTAAVIPAGTTIKAGGFYLIGQADAASMTAARKGAGELYLSSPIAAGSKVRIGGSEYTISAEGTPAGAMTTIFIPVSTGPRLSIPVGAKNIPVTSAAGFVQGQKMGIDLGGNYEVVTVTEVGTPATQSTLSEAAKVGDTELTIEVTSALRPGDQLTIDTGNRIEVVTVKEIIRNADAPAPRRFGQPYVPHVPGIISITKPLEKDHIEAVDVSCPGSGISFEPATQYAHQSGDAVQPLGSAFAITPALGQDAMLLEAVALADAQADLFFGHALSMTAGSIALVDPSTGTIIDSMVYGSKQSNSSANGTVASPELATLESIQDAGGNIAVVPQVRPNRFPGAPVVQTPYRSLSRYPDGMDTDNLEKDFNLSETPTPGQPNQK